MILEFPKPNERRQPRKPRGRKKFVRVKPETRLIYEDKIKEFALYWKIPIKGKSLLKLEEEVLQALEKNLNKLASFDDYESKMYDFLHFYVKACNRNTGLPENLGINFKDRLPKGAVSAARKKKNPTDTTYRMKFGKHRGERISDVPDNYLAWIQREFDPENPNNHVVLDEVRKEIAKRHLPPERKISKKRGDRNDNKSRK